MECEQINFSLHWPQWQATILHFFKTYFATYQLTANDMNIQY